MEKVLKITSPESFRITNTTRIGQYRTEKTNGEFQLSTLTGREDDVDILKIKAKSLKEQVKQTIEILEEDHGKAIRVFTIVTLFFLPLSFVSSFMGMNTTDIRDTEFSQRIFWITAIPVTVAVLGLAFMYGYKGDEFENWLSQQPRWPTSWRPWGLREGDDDGLMGASRTGSFNLATTGTFNLTTEGQATVPVDSEKTKPTMSADGVWVAKPTGYGDHLGMLGWMHGVKARTRLPTRERKPGQRGLRRSATGDSIGVF